MPQTLPWLSIDPGSRHVSIDVSHPGFYGDPYLTYEAVRMVTPVFFWREHGFWSFLDAEDVGSLLRDRRFGRELTGGGAAPGREPPAAHLAAWTEVNRNSMLEREPPVHTRLRALVSRAFVTRNIERLRPRVNALAHELIDGFCQDGRAELLKAYATPIPVTVIAELLGVPTEMAPQLLEWSHRMVSVYELGHTRHDEELAETATKEFSSYLAGHIRDRKRRPGDDLITHLLEAEASGDRLSEDELLGTCILLLNAGHEATVHAIGNSVKTLLQQRTDLGSAFASDASVEATVDECLRFDPPLHLFCRYAQEDLEVCGVRLHRGDQVALLYGAANRDPKRYPDAGRFDPSRPASAHATFGGGIHFCLGAPLARLELQIALPTLFRRLPGLELDGVPEYRDNYHFHGLRQLPVRWGASARRAL